MRFLLTFSSLSLGASEAPRKSNGATYQPQRTVDNDTSAVARFSSIGWTVENRIKPDVVAPGSAILSAKSRDMADPNEFTPFGASSDPLWAYCTGTSMATPLAAGCVAIVRHALLKPNLPHLSGQFSPTAALIKALIIHYATDMSGQHQMATSGGANSQRAVTYDAPPDMNYGYGRINVDAGVHAIGQRRNMGTYAGGCNTSPIFERLCRLRTPRPLFETLMAISRLLLIFRPYVYRSGRNLPRF